MNINLRISAAKLFALSAAVLLAACAQPRMASSDSWRAQTETPDFTAVFTNKGAGLKSFVLKKYKDDQKKPLDLVSEKAGNTVIYPFSLPEWS